MLRRHVALSSTINCNSQHICTGAWQSVWALEIMFSRKRRERKKNILKKVVCVCVCIKRRQTQFDTYTTPCTNIRSNSQHSFDNSMAFECGEKRIHLLMHDTHTQQSLTLSFRLFDYALSLSLPPFASLPLSVFLSFVRSLYFGRPNLCISIYVFT